MTNERQRYIEQLERMLDEAEFTANHEDTEQTHQRIAQGDVDALTAAIAALQREGEMEEDRNFWMKLAKTVADQMAEMQRTMLNTVAERAVELKKREASND